MALSNDLSFRVDHDILWREVNMANVVIALGIVLSLLGLGAYFGTGRQSITALIPAFLGLPIAALGLVARDPRRLKAAMHASVVLALLGFLGSVRGVRGAIALASGEEVARPTAVVIQTVMAVLCAIFLLVAVKSFLDARRHRSA
jgi:hypothetical protein